MHFADGAYVSRSGDAVIIRDGIGVSYVVERRAGRIALRSDGRGEDVSFYSSPGELFSGICGFDWCVGDDSITFVDASELPFSGHPPVSASLPHHVLGFSDDAGENPVLAWLLSSGFAG